MTHDDKSITEVGAGHIHYGESLTDHLLNRMAILAEQHLGNNLAHIRRVSLFSYQIATHLGLNEQHAQTIAAAARLHDIGMGQVPSAILKKTGSLTKTELKAIHAHVAAGLRLVGRKRDPLVQTARVIIASHHERHDGGGYPDGLAGNAIPIEGRIVAVADTFDALCSPRPYRHQTAPATAISIIISGGGGVHFDPDVVNAFAACRRQILSISKHYPHR